MMHALALAFVLASYGGPYAEHVVSGRGVLVDVPQTACAKIADRYHQPVIAALIRKL